MIVRFLTGLCLLALAGCDFARPTTTSGASVAWSSYTLAKGVPGIDEASVGRVEFNGQSAFVLWVDESSLSSSSSGNINASQPNVCYRLKTKSGLVCECLASEGRAHTMVIDGKSFKLEDGSFILVAANSGPVRVKQLKRALDMPKLHSEDLQKLARSTDEIREFFEGAAKVKSEEPAPKAEAP